MTDLSNEIKNHLRETALNGGADFAAWIDPAEIPIMPEIQDICRQNGCGLYGTSWKGPPAIGSVEELEPVIRSYSAGLVVQTVGHLEDAFDYPGMLEAKANHQTLFGSIAAKIGEQACCWETLALSAGCCAICDDCTYPDQPCRQPEKAIAPVEGYGVYVNAMLTLCGLKYNNGPDTVSYVGLILFREAGGHEAGGQSS
jgi:predicted metal-binding protein